MCDVRTNVKTAMKTFLAVYFCLLTVVVSGAALAKEAQPLAADPALEKRVNDITKELRCLVCQNQTIADSHADLAKDLKNQVRQMVKAGKTESQIDDYMVKRYGDFVLYRPAVEPKTYLLWTGPFLLMVAGIVLLMMNLRKRKKIIVDAPLSADENDRLQSLLDSDTSSTNKAEGDVKPS
jgi:cytochrome c-type biogenesis protein CcmH